MEFGVKLFVKLNQREVNHSYLKYYFVVKFLRPLSHESRYVDVFFDDTCLRKTWYLYFEIAPA